jgi:hypothetical protein
MTDIPFKPIEYLSTWIPDLIFKYQNTINVFFLSELPTHSLG